MQTGCPASSPLARPARRDEALQRQAGWTSSRLRRVLHELAKAGVVDVVDAETNGPGRPSKNLLTVFRGKSLAGEIVGYGERGGVLARRCSQSGKQQYR